MAYFALFGDLGFRQVHGASSQYIDLVEIVREADVKDSNDDSFADMDGAVVEELEV